MPSALLLVDLATDFLPGGRRAAPNAEQILAVANQLLPRFPLAVATRRTADAASPLPPELDTARLSFVVAFEPQDSVEAQDSVKPKDGVDSNNRGSANSTDLENYLREQDVDELYILGFGTEHAVRSTALAARSLGFRTFLIEDACPTCDARSDDAARASAELAEAGVQFVESKWLAAPVERLCESKFLRLLKRGPWEYVQRTHPAGAVVIVAVTDDDCVVLTDQWRVPVGRRVIEMPAGIVGDEPEQSDEPRLAAAQRELLEETGFEADEWHEALTSVSSAGLTDETVTFFLARGLRRVADGGGIAHEKILVHLVPLAAFDLWLDQRLAAGYQVDGRLYSGIWLWRRWNDRLRSEPKSP